MKDTTHILYRSDFADPEFFDYILEAHDIPTHTIVAGRVIDREIDSIAIKASVVEVGE